VQHRNHLKSRTSGRFLSRAELIFLLVLVPVVCLSQVPHVDREIAPTSAAKAPQGRSKPGFVLRVSKAEPNLITLKAEKILLPEIASALSNKLRVPVILSDLMRKQKITIEFEGLALEPAMRLLGPQVFIDYELNGNVLVQPKPLAIYIYAYNETPPSLSATVKSNTDTLLIEGDTEEGSDQAQKESDSKDDKPLQVKYDKQLVSIKSKKQPLTAVLAELAVTLGIPFELRYESREIIDKTFNNYRLEDAIQQLSPNVRFYLRSDLQRAESIPLRIVLVAPSKS
jgi:hypothetical protein